MISDYIKNGIQEVLSRHTCQETSLEDILAGIENRTYQLFEFQSGFLITCHITYEQASALRIAIAYGNIDLEQDYIMKVVEEFAHYLKVDFIEIWGRRGWVRQLAKYGYNEQYTVVVKPLRREHERFLETNAKE
jgi:hypothetical protein